MLILKGHSNIIANTLKLKGVPFEHKKAEANVPILVTRNFELHGLHSIIQYLDERFPVPQLISGDADNRARIRAISRLLIKNPSYISDLIKQADPFILGNHLTVIDLIANELTTDSTYKQRIHGVINATF